MKNKYLEYLYQLLNQVYYKEQDVLALVDGLICCTKVTVQDLCLYSPLKCVGNVPCISNA